MPDSFLDFLKRLRKLREDLAAGRTPLNGMFRQAGVRFSNTSDEALVRERIQMAREGKPFPEQEGADLDSIDDRFVETMIDDMFDDML